MPIAHRTIISFGLVAIPVGLYTAVQDNDIHFNQLHKDDGTRIRYKKTCPHCGKEVTSEDIVNGYEYTKDQYVIITDDDLEKIKTEKERSIQILHFAQINQISPVYYEKTYQAIPEPGGEKAFELLRVSLMEEQKIAIGKTVLGTKSTLMAIIPRENGVLVTTMHYQAEIKELQRSYAKPEILDTDKKLAKQLIGSMDTPFVPEQYVDEFQMKLRDAIDTKVAGKEIIAAAPDIQPNVINLTDALMQSIKERTGKKPASRSKVKTLA